MKGNWSKFTFTVFAVLCFAALSSSVVGAEGSRPTTAESAQVSYHRTTIDGVEIFYRAAGPVDAPAIVLLHGFPTSSQMYRELIPRLSDKYRVIAPDFPGFGQSAAPSPDQYKYSFEGAANLIDKLLVSLDVDRYALYLMDYGAPVASAKREMAKRAGASISEVNASHAVYVSKPAAVVKPVMAAATAE